MGAEKNVVRLIWVETEANEAEPGEHSRKTRLQAINGLSDVFACKTDVQLCVIGILLMG